MSYDHGSIDLGIKNPFRKQGAVVAVRGAFTLLLAVLLLLQVGSATQQDPMRGWAMAGFGFALMALGLRTIWNGMSQMLRFFVGRSVPASLAPNFADSESYRDDDGAIYSRREVTYYDKDSLEQMLVARKNPTYREPDGVASRLFHTLFPKLTFMPWPFRSLFQRVAAVVLACGFGLIALLFVAFFTATGLIPTTAATFPLLSSALCVMLVYVWMNQSRRINDEREALGLNLDGGFLVKLLIMTAAIPAATAMVLQSSVMLDEEAISGFRQTFQLPSPHILLTMIVGMTLVSAIPVCLLMLQRARHANPSARVSEHRDNWQESVHPKDLFFNLETMVMANRRYKEVPNREYWPLEPDLKEETQRKGDFTGRLLHETQPAFSPFPDTPGQQNMKLIATIAGQAALLAVPVFLFNAPDYLIKLIAGFQQYQNVQPSVVSAAQAGRMLGESLTLILAPAMALLYALVLSSMGKVIARAAHLAWAEMPFESLMVFVKMDGTYSESRLSTGSAIHDSTRSENLVVRSSITSWVVVSRIMSTVFATTGRNNLEGARLVYEMRMADDDLASILDDLKNFFRRRKTIATIGSEEDLAAAASIASVNQQTRAVEMRAGIDLSRAISDEEGGAARQRQESRESIDGDGDEGLVSPAGA